MMKRKMKNIFLKKNQMGLLEKKSIVSVEKI